MKTIYRIFFIIIPILVLSSCINDTYTPTLAIGLWKQVSVSEDGIDMILTPEQKTCQLLIDLNGAYRCYHQSFKSFNNGNGPTSFYGSWNLTDGKWINFSVDKWQIIAPITSDSNKVVLSYKNGVIDTLVTVQKQWSQYHIPTRFTILQLSDTVMEIRLKTFVGEKNYALLFAPNPTDFIELKPAQAGKPIYTPKLVSDQNYWVIRKELQTLKTYIFKFRKVSY